MTARSPSTPFARCVPVSPWQPRRVTLRISRRRGCTEFVALFPCHDPKAEIKADNCTSSLLTICCNWCTYIRRGWEGEGEHDESVLEGDTIRDRQCGRTVALGANHRDGLPARPGHVWGHGRSADPDGVRP